MKVEALWYGGSNYANPSIPRDIEQFRSLRHARDIFEHRAGNTDRYYPCVEGSEMHIYFGEYTENGPDRVLTIGPRGGVRMERA